MVSDPGTTNQKQNDPSVCSGRSDASIPHGKAVAWSPLGFSLTWRGSLYVSLAPLASVIGMNSSHPQG